MTSAHTSSPSARRRGLLRFGAALSTMAVVGMIVLPSADAATKKKTTKKKTTATTKAPYAPQSIPTTAAPAPTSTPTTAAAPVTTATPTTVAGSLKLTSDAKSRLVAPGSSVTYVLTVTRTTSDPASMFVSNLPAGVTATLSANPVLSTVTMTLSTIAGVTPGGYQSFLVSAKNAGGSATLTLELVVDTTLPTVTTATTAPVRTSFAPTVIAGATGPIAAGSGNYVSYQVNLNRPVGMTSAATVSLGTIPTGLATGLSATVVGGESFVVSFSAATGDRKSVV